MADIRATKNCFLQLIKSTNLFDQALNLSNIKDIKQKQNQNLDFVSPEIDEELDLSSLKSKRSDNPEALNFLTLVEQGQENIFLTGKAGS